VNKELAVELEKEFLEDWNGALFAEIPAPSLASLASTSCFTILSMASIFQASLPVSWTIRKWI